MDQIRLPGMCVCFGWDKDGDLLAAITGMNCLKIGSNLSKLIKVSLHINHDNTGYGVTGLGIQNPIHSFLP